MRRGYTKFTIEDFEKHPVWELQGSLTMAEPYKGKIPFESDPTRAYFVKTAFKLADKTTKPGWTMICVPPYDVNSLNPTILTDDGPVDLTKLASKPKEKDVEEAYRRLGGNSGQVFPLSFETVVAIPKGPAKAEVSGFLHRFSYKDENGWSQHLDFFYQSASELNTALKKHQRDEAARKAVLEPSKDEVALHQASRSGDAKQVAALVAKGVDVNRGGVVEEGGYTRKNVTPLMMASEAGHKSVVQILLEARAEIHLVEETNEPRQGGKTALACACRKNQLGTARMLLQAGADPNHKLSFGHTILDEACYEADVELIKLLLKFGGNPNASCGKADYFALERAVASSRFDVIKLLLDLGADINASGSNQETILMKASELMRPGIVRFLLERGANASGLGYEGATALYNLVWSARHIRPDLDKDASEMIRKTMEVAKLLVERGADVNAATKDGDSPMTLAKQCKFSDLGNLFKTVEKKN